ncbi:MAG TPA: beta-ketoacyl synthase N-terminal-like domain-containing protein [Acidimicrobiales bacterium]|nr:beta-ketoacyl synthase N-terminal-like domain-containing protein [Acidimicrobiales bacterium]
MSSTLEEHQVVVSGAGVVSAYGVGVIDFQMGLLSGRAGVGVREASSSPLRPMDRHRVLGQAEASFAKAAPPAVGEEARVAELAAFLAFMDADAGSACPGAEVLGIAMSGHYSGLQDYAEQFWAGACEPDGMVSATRGPRTGFNATAGHLGIGLSAEGPNVTLVNGSIGGIDALIYAADALNLGRADAMIVCGVDRVPGVMVPLLRRACGTLPARPFDRLRDGPTAGDGAVALLLERRRPGGGRPGGRRIEIAGAATASATGVRDASRLAMRKALALAECEPAEVRAVIAGANGSREGDSAEALAIAEAVSEGIPTTAVRGGIGDCPASGALAQVATGVLSIESGALPPTPGFEDPDPEIPVSVSRHPRPIDGGPVLVNSWDEGGVAGSVLLR